MLAVDEFIVGNGNTFFVTEAEDNTISSAIESFSMIPGEYGDTMEEDDV